MGHRQWSDACMEVGNQSTSATITVHIIDPGFGGKSLDSHK